MVFVGFFFIELLVLFFLSQYLTRLLSSFFFRVTKSKNATIHLLSILFLPGVIIHELAHLITAGILFIPLGDVEFAPKIQGNNVKLGSVQIAKTDPIRRAVIGFAPIFVGFGIIFTTLYYSSSLFAFFPCHAEFISASKEILNQVQNGTNCNIYSTWQLALLIYILFEIGNTMFSSKKDMEGTVEILATIAIVAGILYAAGIRIDFLFLKQFFPFDFTPFLKQIDIFLLVPLVLDGIIVGLMNLTTK